MPKYLGDKNLSEVHLDSSKEALKQEKEHCSKLRSALARPDEAVDTIVVDDLKQRLTASDENCRLAVQLHEDARNFDAEEFSIIRKRLEDQLNIETSKPPTVIRDSLAVDAVKAELATEGSKSTTVSKTIFTFEREAEAAKGEITFMTREEDRLRGELELASL